MIWLSCVFNCSTSTCVYQRLRLIRWSWQSWDILWLVGPRNLLYVTILYTYRYWFSPPGFRSRYLLQLFRISFVVSFPFGYDLKVMKGNKNCTLQNLAVYCHFVHLRQSIHWFSVITPQQSIVFRHWLVAVLCTCFYMQVICKCTPNIGIIYMIWASPSVVSSEVTLECK